MSKFKAMTTYFKKGELALWGGSVLSVLLSLALPGGNDPLSVTASLIGVTSLIFCAKGNPFGQLLMVIFSVLYGIISLSFRYYGEMITYLGMTAPMAVFSLFVWLKNPFNGQKSQVEVRKMTLREVPLMLIATSAVTIALFFILNALGTSNLLTSTLSVTTSFAAAYLTAKRSPLYALAYAANDIVLIVLWVMAAIDDPSYLSVLICFTAFLFNDIYGFISWRKMYIRQLREAARGKSDNNSCIFDNHS